MLLAALAPAAVFAQAACPRPETSRPRSRAATTSQIEQSEVKIRVRKLTFTGQTGLTPVELADIVAAIKDSTGDERGWLHEFEGRIQDAWQQRGYFKAEIKAQTRLISETPSEKTFDVTAHVESGRLYRLGDISFVGGTQFAPEQLLLLFPIHSGEIFNTHHISNGIDALRKAYGARGFINFTPVPNTLHDEAHGSVSIEIELDEGSQFRISATHVFGLDSISTKALLLSSGLEPGDVADPEMMDRFEKEHPAEIERFIDNAKATVCMQISLAQSPQN